MDRSQKTLDRLYNDVSQKQYQLSKYDEAIKKATGDQKTALITARNNLADSLAQTKNSIEITTSGVGDTVSRIQELRAKAVVAAESRKSSVFNREATAEERRIETEFAAGKLSKEEYIKSKLELEQTRLSSYDYFANTFRQYGADDTATAFDTKVLESERKIDENIKPIADNIGNYEAYREGNKKIELRDFTNDKANGFFENKYLKVGNVFRKVQTGSEINPITGEPYSSSEIREKVRLGQTQPFYLDENNKKKPIVILEVQRPDGTKQNVYWDKSLADKNGKFTAETVTNKNGLAEKSQTLYKIADNTIPYTGPNALQEVGRNIVDTFKGKNESINALGNAITKPVDFVQQAIQKFFPQVKAAEAKETVKAPLLQTSGNKNAIDKVIVNLPENQKEAARLISKALADQGILDPNTLAYALATAQHETASSFKPVNEGFFNDEKYGYEPGFTGKSEANKRGYGGGENYFGRGYIQLTHLGNYQKYGKQLGLDLVNNPELANVPENAAKIMAAYFKDRGTAALASKGDFIGARGTVNPDDKGFYIAGLANQYLKSPNLLKGIVNAYASEKKIGSTLNKNMVKPKLQTPVVKKNILQQIGDFIVPPVSSFINTKNPLVTKTKTQSVQSTNPFVPNSNPYNVKQPSSNNNQNQQSFQQKTTPQVSVPAPKPVAYNAPTPASTYGGNIKPAFVQQQSKPAPSPKPPQQNIVQKVISSVTNFIKKLKWW